MKMTKKYRRNALATIQEAMEAPRNSGFVDKQAMREFDAACFAPIVVISSDEQSPE